MADLNLEKVRTWANHSEHSADDCKRGDEMILRLADEVERLRADLPELEKARNAFDLAFAVMKGRGDLSVPPFGIGGRDCCWCGDQGCTCGS